MTRMQQRRDTAINWTNTNPTLAAGEFGTETDTLKVKIGNGSLAWNNLSYIDTTLQNLVNTKSPISNPSFSGIASAPTGSFISVGIGTTTPSGELHIISTGIGAMIGSYNTWTDGGKLRIYNDDNDSQPQSIKSFVSKTGVGLNIAVNGTSYTVSGNGSGTNIGLYGYASNGSGNYGLYVDAGYGYFNSRVGIGTTTPNSQLHVVGTGIFSSSLLVNNNIVWHSGNFDNSNIVRTTGTQTIGANKTFSLPSNNDALIIGNNSLGFRDGSGDSDFNSLAGGELNLELTTNNGLGTKFFVGSGSVGISNVVDGGGSGPYRNRLFFNVASSTSYPGGNTTLTTSSVTGNITIALPNTSGTLALLNNNIFILGAVSGSTAINFASDKQLQTMTLGGTATTFTKGSGWPSNNTSVDVVLRTTVTSATSITWTIVNDWFNQPPAGALSIGTHLFLLRAIGSSIVEGHYIGSKTN
jgi:hypothetical protein